MIWYPENLTIKGIQDSKDNVATSIESSGRGDNLAKLNSLLAQLCWHISIVYLMIFPRKLDPGDWDYASSLHIF